MSEFLREHVSFQGGFAIFLFGYQKLTMITPNYNCKKFPHSKKNLRFCVVPRVSELENVP